MNSKTLVAYFFIYFVWGGNFLSIFYAIQSIPPFLMIGSRFLLAGGILFLIAYWRDRRLPTFQEARPAMWQAWWFNVLGTTTLVWSEQYVPSGIAAILGATTPIWIVLMDRANWRGNLSNVWILGGFLFGMIGVALLTWDGDIIPAGVTREMFLLGALVINIGNISWAYGSVAVNRKKTNSSIFMNVAIQLSFAGAIQFIIGLGLGELWQFSWAAIQAEAFWSMIHLVFFSSVIGYVAYIWLLRYRPPMEVSTHTFVNPAVAVLLGVWLAHETATISTMVSLVLVLCAVFLIRYNRFLRPLNFSL